MPSRSTVYSADVLTLNFAGIDCANGWGKGGTVKITQPDKPVTYTQGLDGEGVFNQKPSGPSIIQATYLQTSKTNALLSAYHIASLAAGGLPGPLVFADRNGTSKIVSVAAMLESLPDEDFQAEAGDILWTFIVHDPQRFVGSH